VVTVTSKTVGIPSSLHKPNANELSAKVVKYDSICGFLFMGWALHYLPFFLEARQLFLHHYFPALYFAILLWCTVFDLATSTLRPRVRLQIAAAILVAVIFVFSIFSPLAYGSPWTKAKCRSAQWVHTWDFACNDMHDDVSFSSPHLRYSTAYTNFSVALAI
jgi:dolichyl-phosphate-mannose-protein mannosyltransferase